VTARRAALLVVAAAALPWLAGLVARPIYPIDETRYLSVAWEMWLRQDLLVPHLNGAPYSDKPPLLFWLILLGWRVVGVAEWWARLVPVLSGLASAWLTARVARRLWPGRPEVGPLAAVILAGTIAWAAFTQAVLFDALLTATLLTALLGLLAAAEGRRWGFALLALGIGAGVLAKGPVTLMHLLPASLLAPWWGAPRSRVAWYAGVLAAVGGGAAIALAWAVPAARQGGPAYADAIFVRQTADRMVHAFAHRRPVWWYLPWFPALLLPWAAWPAAWRAMRDALRLDDRGVRFLAAWALPVFVGFSLVSGKQVHYLLPLLPAAALALARALDGRPAANFVPRATLALAVVLAAAELASPRFLESEDLRPWAARLAALEREGYEIGHADHYAGQYHFLGRLERPFVELPRRGGESWLAAGPHRALVSYPHEPGAAACPRVGKLLAEGPYRGHTVCITLSDEVER